MLLFVMIGLMLVGLLGWSMIWWARSLSTRRWRCRRTTRQVEAELPHHDSVGNPTRSSTAASP
jgi:hypothetical protein